MMEKLKTNELSLGLNQTFRNDLVDNFEKIQKGVDSQADNLNKQILDMLGSVAPQDQNEVTQARIDGNGKAYDTLKGREDATQSTAETALSEERDISVEVQDARTNSSSQTYPTLKARIDNQENDLNNSINSKLAQISAVPEAFANLSALQLKYPTGKTGLFVTADTGHKYVWSNNTWTDAGVYQAVGLAKSSVTLDKVDTINSSQIINSLSVPHLSKPWANAFVSVSGDDIIVTKDTSRTGDDFGVSVPVFLQTAVSATDTLYLNFDYYSNSVTGDSNVDKMEVWLLDSSQKLVKKISPSFFYLSTDKKSYQLLISGSDLLSSSVGNEFYLMVAIHADVQLNISNYRTNFDNSKKRLTKEVNNKAVVSQARKTSGFNQNFNISVVDDHIIAKSSDSTINPVFEVPYYGLDLARRVYVTAEYYTDSNTSTLAHVWISKIVSTTPNYSLEKGSGRLEVSLTPNELQRMGVKKDGVIAFTTGNSSSEGIIINHLSISNQAIDGELGAALDYVDNTSVNRSIETIGQPINNIDTAVAKTVSGIDFVTPKANYNGNDGVLKRVRAYVSVAGSYKFKLAKIDQNALIVDATNDFVLSLSAGYNDVDVEKMGIIVSNGSQLFMDVSSTNVYTPDANHLYATNTLIRDNSHPTTNNGYSGQMMYDANVLIPFNYDVIDRDPFSALDELESSFSKQSMTIEQLVLAKNNVILKSPSGKGFRLLVSDDGSLSTASQVVSKATVFGNSLTKYDAIGGFGLAASNQNSDWFAGVKSYINSANSSAELLRGTIGGWESAITSSDRQNYFDSSIKPSLTSDTDLVIIQAGDNVNTADKAANIYSDSKQLILNIKQVSPKARVFWVASWFVSKFANVDLIASIKKACSETGTNFIDITGYSSVSGNNSYIGAKITKPDGTVITVTDSGYAAHPGDNGHKAISDLVIANLGF